MGDHILAEVEVFDPQSCHVEPYATEEWTVTDVSRSALGRDAGEVVESFTLRGDRDADLPESVARPPVEKVFSFEGEHVFRVTRPADQPCVCDRVARAGCVVRDITATADSLVVTFLVAGTGMLQCVIEDLEATAERIRLRRLVESADGARRGRPIVLDRDALTDRQAEVLDTAYELGYFEHPRDATAGDVAAALDISTTTFTEHLAAAQRKLLSELLDG